MEFKPAKLLTAAVLIDASELAAMLSIKKTPTLWGMVSAKLLPAPLRLSRTCIRWRRTDIEAFIASLEPERADVSTARDEPSDDSVKSIPWNRCEWLAFQGMEG